MWCGRVGGVYYGGIGFFVVWVGVVEDVFVWEVDIGIKVIFIVVGCFNDSDV